MKSLSWPQSMKICAMKQLKKENLKRILLKFCLCFWRGLKFCSDSHILCSSIQNSRILGQKNVIAKLNLGGNLTDDKLERWAICINAPGQKLVSPTSHFLTISGNCTLSVRSGGFKCKKAYFSTDKSGLRCVHCALCNVHCQCNAAAKFTKMNWTQVVLIAQMWSLWSAECTLEQIEHFICK